MSKANALAGLIGSYGDSDEDSEELHLGSRLAVKIPAKPPPLLPVAPVMAGFPTPPAISAIPSGPMLPFMDVSAAIHPAPIPHCPWSACYDETSGFTYYWNQHTNAVTWEAPPEYLLALKLAQQQLNTAGSEVSAEEWQLYQQALAEKQNTQNKVISKATPKPIKKPNVKAQVKQLKYSKKKQSFSNDEEEDDKIELITSYYHSDSDSNDEESPVKVVPAPKPPINMPSKPPIKPPSKPPSKPPLPKSVLKRRRSKLSTVEYGPSLPLKHEYTVPIGPDLPSNVLNEVKIKSPVLSVNAVTSEDEGKKTPKQSDQEDSQDESLLLMKLKDKAKLLEKLGGELPSDLQKIIQDETCSLTSSPKVVDEDNKNGKDDAKFDLKKDIKLDVKQDTNIDDLLDEIEKKELPKIKPKVQIDMFGEDQDNKLVNDSTKTSPRSESRTPPLTEELKPLFPSSKVITDKPDTFNTLFPSASKIHENGTDTKPKLETTVPEKKANVYIMDSSEPIENPKRKKLRISNSVLPERKKSDIPSYTTKYSQYIEGFSSERTGLGFTKEDEAEVNPKNIISYGKGLTFTKGETLNEDKNELDELTELVDAKLRYLNQVQPCLVTPVQEMLIQMQTLAASYRSGALTMSYWRRWSTAAAAALAQHEASAAPPGWTCHFQRSEGRYQYRRQSDGLTQWEYPAAAHMDMEICTTPPHPGIEVREDPPLPPLPPPPPPAPPPAPPLAPPPAPRWARVVTPPPPVWSDPPPPGCDIDEPPPLPPEPPQQEIGDELLSFYNDIAELEKMAPPPAPSAPCTPPLPPPAPPERDRDRADKEKEKDTKSRKKSKVKISSAIGMKQKSVSNLVAKWQQVADEINSE